MKKIILSILFSCLMLPALFAQADLEKKELQKTGSQTMVNQNSLSNIPKCFCCDSAYQLPARPPIDGPRTFSCGTKATFSTTPCPGASFNWTISPSISGVTGLTTSSITIPATAPAGTYTITVTIRCGRNIVSNQFTFTITQVPNCTPAFTITVTQLTNGFLSINAVPAMLTPGQEHYWGIQYNGTYPNCNVPCAAIPFTSFNSTGVWGGWIDASGTLHPYMGSGITTGTTPYGINYSGFPNNSCFKITHYVKCCGQLVRQTQCVSIGTTNARSANPGDMKPNITVGQIETVDLKN